MTDIHSCSYYCDRPECIKAQRDELRDKLAQPKQEPVGTVGSLFDENVIMRRMLERDMLVYTTPPQRTWVGLTDDDLEFWTNELGQGELGRGVIRAVADHLKELNHERL